jgi:Spy/CpxP family protein refolding chaperone
VKGLGEQTLNKPEDQMKLHKMSLVAGLVLSGLLACGSMAMAQDAKAGKEGGKRGKGFPTVEERLERMTQALNLTDDQKPKVKAALEEQETAMKALAPEDRRSEKAKTIREDFNKKMKGILTPEQNEKFEKFQSSMRPGGRKKGQGDKKE